MGLLKRSLPGVYNVVKYGADPTGAVSSQAAFAAALADATAHGAGVVYAPAGVYLLTSYLQFTLSNVSLVGDGMGATILYCVDTLAFPYGLLIGSTALHGNHIRELTIDCNGSRGAQFTNAAAVITMSNDSVLERVEICNKNGSVFGTTIISGTTTVFIGGRGVTVRGCRLHSDFCWQTTAPNATPIGAAGANKDVVVASTANFSYTANCPGNQTVVIDPSVSAVASAFIPSGVQTVTPVTESDNPRPGAGLTTGMVGIYVGQPLTIDTANTDKVTAVTVNSGGSGFTNGTYTGVPLQQGGGSGGLATVVVSGGAIQSITPTDPGVGYSTTGPFTPTFVVNGVTIAGLGGTGASVSYTLSNLQEVVQVSAATVSTFTATFVNMHHLDCPISYQGATEMLQIGGVNVTGSSTIRLSTQLAHPANPQVSGKGNGDVCIVGFGATYDAIAADGQSSFNKYVEDVLITGNRFERLGEDACGLAVGRRWTVTDNFIARCPSGLCVTDGSDYLLARNYVDLSWFGVMPWQLGLLYLPNQVWSGISVVQGASVATGAAQSDYKHGVIADNILIGGTYGVIVTAGGSFFQRQLTVSGNSIDKTGLQGLYLQGVKGVSLGDNSVTNANSYGFASTAGLTNGTGLPVSALLILGSSSSTACDALAVTGNTFSENRGTPLMQAAVVVYGGSGAGGFVTNTAIRQNTCVGSTSAGGAIQTVGCPGGAVVASGNVGYNPRKLTVNTTLAAYCSPVMATNGQPVTGQAYVNSSAVDYLVYIQNPGSITSIQRDGTTLGTSFSAGDSFLWPAGSTLTVTWGTTTQPVLLCDGL